MKKTSIASLQERLADWLPWDQAMYQLGACLGFWPEFGAPSDAFGPFDPWHGVKDVIYTNKHYLGAILENFLRDLTDEGCLEASFEYTERDGPQTYYRWNTEYKGMADVMSIL